MSIEWIAIEILAVFVDSFVKVFFLNRRYISKYKSKASHLLLFTILLCWGIFATFSATQIWIYDGTSYILLLFYLFLVKRGTILQKLFGATLTYALLAGVSLTGAGLAALLARTSVEATQIYQDNSRLLAIVLIKTFQVAVFYALAKKHYRIRSLRKRSLAILSFVVVIIFFCLLLIIYSVPNFSTQTSGIFTVLSIGLLIIMIIIFILYEMFVREESRNIDLSERVQRLELETHFFQELDAVYSDIRTWRHEYKNNLIVIRSLIELGETEKTINYIDTINADSAWDNTTLQTGNMVLDAVVSSKLWLARSRGIDISIQAVYPENNCIEDNDLCAITGNLLDNAIEACDRISDDSQKRFITFSLLMKGKNLILSISNSYYGEIKKEGDGDGYSTTKDKRFHGIGIRYVDSIVSKYQGHVLRDYEDGVFNTHVALPLIPYHKEEKNP